MISFSRLKIIKQVINKDLKKKPQEQSFSFHDALQTYRLDWIRFDQNDDNFTYKALAVAFKKAFFQIYLHFPDFLQVWKIVGQMSRLFQDFKTLYETCVFSPLSYM